LLDLTDGTMPRTSANFHITPPVLLWLLYALSIALWVPPASAQDTAPAWSLLRQPGYVAFMRHSEAPGYADPPNYNLDDCSTQCNLVDSGRAHARRTGEAFRRNGITFQRVLTSPWCRCKETALLAMGRDAEVFAPLSNLVGRSQHTTEQVAALKAYLAALDAGTRVLFVTHGIVIQALTGISPASGEMVIVRLDPSGNPVVAGRLLVD
jgi:phosphohistidine phosphatase SixA